MVESRNRTYICGPAREDVVHHEAAWVLKATDRQPLFVSCRAVEDPSRARGYRFEALLWSRGDGGGWAPSPVGNPEGYADALDAAGAVDAVSADTGAVSAPIPFTILEETVTESDVNYLIALAIAIDSLPPEATLDGVSERIRDNADADMAERAASVMPDQPDPMGRRREARDGR